MRFSSFSPRRQRAGPSPESIAAAYPRDEATATEPRMPPACSLAECVADLDQRPEIPCRRRGLEPGPRDEFAHGVVERSADLSGPRDRLRSETLHPANLLRCSEREELV